ncbi:MAG: hydrogenase 3 maturation endopeptidase HyCI [Candidatus Bathyarchaeia archaeon]
MESETRKDLRKWLLGAKKVVVAGIGNPIRMDDFVGVKIVQDLQGKVSDKVYLIECETVPENYIQQITEFKPTHVLLIDAAIFGSKPGESRLVKVDELKMFPAFSTHVLPLRVFCEYLTKTLKADIRLLLIQPKQTDFGEGLTPELAASAQDIAKELLSVLP